MFNRLINDYAVLTRECLLYGKVMNKQNCIFIQHQYFVQLSKIDRDNLSFTNFKVGYKYNLSFNISVLPKSRTIGLLGLLLCHQGLLNKKTNIDNNRSK